MFAARVFARPSRAAAAAVRRMSGGHSAEEHAKEVATWRKYSYVMAGVTSFFTVYNVVLHSHDHPRTDLPYMNIRNKPFPWRECPTCNLFDGDCWKKCRGEEVEDAGHH